jgi:hypothetical protein
MERSNVIENPERPTLCRHNQVVVVNLDVAYRNVREIQLKRLPVCAVVERNEHPKLGSRVQQTFTRRILANDTRWPIDRNAIVSGS